jgi:hypothetical protein
MSRGERFFGPDCGRFAATRCGADSDGLADDAGGEIVSLGDDAG